jgi:hypothetical protein
MKIWNLTWRENLCYLGDLVRDWYEDVDWTGPSEGFLNTAVKVKALLAQTYATVNDHFRAHFTLNVKNEVKVSSLET